MKFWLVTYNHGYSVPYRTFDGVLNEAFKMLEDSPYATEIRFSFRDNPLDDDVDTQILFLDNQEYVQPDLNLVVRRVSFEDDHENR